MIEEIDIDSLKVGLNLPLMKSYKPEDIVKTVKNE